MLWWPLLTPFRQVSFNSFVSAHVRGMVSRPPVFLLHLALVLVIAGALTTHFASKHWTLTLSEGETSTELPLDVTLRSFEVVCYPGTSTPANYVCTLDIDGQESAVSMNHIARRGGYRFLLSSYEEGGDVSLSVSRDPWGTGLVYTGYALLLLSLIGFFFLKNTLFRSALSKVAPVVALLLVTSFAASAQNPKTLPKDVAEEFGHLYVYYNGRIAPMQTMARDYVMKAYGKPSYKGLSAEQVFTGWMLFYDSWKDVPVKKKGMEERRQAVFAVASGRAVKMFPITSPEGTVEWYSSGDRLPVYVSDDEWTFVRKVGMLVGEYAFEKDYDAVSGVISKVAKYQTDRIGEVLPAPSKVRAERAYNAIGRPFVPAICFVMIGIVLFLLAAFGVRGVDTLARACGAFGLTYMTLVLGLRWFVSGHIPMSSGFELMMAICWAACLFVVIAGRNFSAFRPMGVLLAGFAMMVASLGESNPQIGPLQPVLSSPLLSVHVSCMMFAYTLFGMLALCGAMGLISKSDEFACRGRVVLYPALFLMIAGTIVGSVWANISWGSYWSWDPKETWSLITILVYSLPLHSGMLKFLQKPKWFNLFCLLAFSVVLFTYFGVNLLLGGMHSYAG